MSNTEKPIGVCINLLARKRTSFSKIDSIESFCKKENIPYEILDCYDYDIISKLDNYSAIHWAYSNFAIADLMQARNILLIAEKKGIPVFPNHATGWHFDDKIAQMYLLQSINASIPKSWVFYTYESLLQWLEKGITYPLVAKLKNGSGSNNVKLLKDKAAVIAYGKKMFTKGYSPAPSLAYKALSKIQSTYNLKTFIDRFKQIPNFLQARKFAQKMPIEKGYCYFQEFIPNDGYDLKICVVGDKCSFVARNVRKGSFKASGGGECYYQKELVTNDIIKSAFHIADTLGLQQVGFDYVVDKVTGKPYIVEMCYGFDSEVIYNSGGYWTRDFVWNNSPVNMYTEALRTIYLMSREHV